MFGPFPRKSSGAGLFLAGLIGLESGGLKEKKKKKQLFNIKSVIFKKTKLSQFISGGFELNHSEGIQKD